MEDIQKAALKSLTIRPIRKEDAGVLAALAAEFEQYLNSLQKGRSIKSPMTYEVFLRDGFSKNPAFNGLLAELGEEVIGYLLYHHGYISELAARVETQSTRLQVLQESGCRAF